MTPKIYYPRALVTLVAVLNNGTPVPIAAIPRSVEWTRNSARKADTASVTLDYRDFPLDPRIMQAVQVQIHVGTLQHPDLPFAPTLENRRFVGLADTNAVAIGDDNTVTLECRDYTGPFLDRPWPGTRIPASTPLQEAVEMVRVMVVPETLPCVFEDPKAQSKTLDSVLGKKFYEPPENATCWDVLVDMCALFGLVPVWDLDLLRVRTAARAGLGNAMFILGQNIARLSMSRDFKGATKKPVIVKCWDPVRGVALQGRWPTEVKTKPSKKPNTRGAVTVKQEAPVQYNVTGLYTPDELIMLARRIYDEAAEREIQGELETRDMRDPFLSDILSLANGDTLLLAVDPGYSAGIDGMTEAEAVAFLADPRRQNSLTEHAAAAVVAAYKQAQHLDTTFYVAEAQHRWEREEGYSMVAKFINFVFGAGL